MWWDEGQSLTCKSLVVPDPGKISGQLWLLLTEIHSGSAVHVACLGNLAALKPPVVQVSKNSLIESTTCDGSGCSLIL